MKAKNTRFLKIIISFILILGAALTPCNKVSADSSAWPAGPDIYADAAIVMEVETGLVLYEKDIYDTHYPASITKIMTSLLAIENCNLNETVTMSHEAEWDVDFNSSRIGLVEGESLSLRDALYGVMLESANEVSYAVGEHVANGPITEFAKMMNTRAKELGCVNTNFVNPNGLHDDNHYTCAYDMALISRAAILLPEFRTITGARTYTIPPTNKNVARPLANHHRFIKKTIEYEGCIGGKTGGTTEAKTTLVTFAERNGMTLVAVVLHVDTGLHAYEDTAKILDFAFENYSLYPMEHSLAENNSSFPSLFSDITEFAKNPEPDLRITNSDIVLPNHAELKDVEKKVEYLPVEELEHGDNVIGTIFYTYKDKFVGSTDIIYYNENYPLTKAAFESQWPSYLISPDLVFADSNTDTLEKNDTADVMNPVTAKKKTSSHKTILISCITGLVVFLGGFYLLFVEIPHRRRRRIYRRNHKRRMAYIRNTKDGPYDF